MRVRTWFERSTSVGCSISGLGISRRVPLWQAIKAEDLSRISDNLSFLDVIGDNNNLRFQIRFRGAMIGQVFGAADCRGIFLYESLPEPARAQSLRPTDMR